MFRRLLFVLIAAVALALATAGPASAHNSLDSSEPTNGAVVTDSPAELRLVFDKSVPLDTLTLQYIDSTAVRSDLTGFAHGPAGDTEVIAPLPMLQAGEVTVRWRLVSADGHPISGRVTFTVVSDGAVAPVAEDDATTSADAPGSAGVTPAPVGDADGFDEPATTSELIRWLLRFGSYLAIMALGGLIGSALFIWPRLGEQVWLSRTMAWAVVAAAFGTVAKLLVIASDVAGASVFSSSVLLSSSGLSGAAQTDAGRALVFRLLLLGALSVVLFTRRQVRDQTRWLISAGLVVALLTTWAYAGHAKSMRLAIFGVPLDVAHHGAAAVWIGGLALVGLVAVRVTTTDQLVPIVQRFAQVAAISVAVIVATGALQAIRLVGSPADIFTSNHGRYLLFKIAVMAAMLKVADINRRRVARRFQTSATATPMVVASLGRAMATELGVGLVVIAITAALVVTTPAVAESREASAASASPTPPSALTETTAAAAASPPSTASPVAMPQDGDGECTIGSTALSSGASGAEVECLQRALSLQVDQPVEITGIFDDDTEAAVRSFQASNSLTVDGIVGPVTGAALGIWS